MLLVVLGVSVLVGWLGHWPWLTHLLPGLTGMVMQTALDFVLIGIALLMPRREPAAPRLPWLALIPAGLVAVLALANLLQLATGLEFGINLPSLHAWIADDNPKPGQQALPTSISFLLAALSLLLLVSVRRPSSRLIAAGRLTATVLFGIAFAALVGYALRLDLLVSWYLFSRVALHTALGLAMIAVALWWRWDGIEERHGAEERELRSLVSVALVLVAVMASVTAVAVFRNQGEQALARSLTIARETMAQGALTAIRLHGSRAEILSTRPQLRAAFRDLVARPNDAVALATARAYLDGFLGYGFGYIAVLDADGRILLAVGVPAAGGTQLVQDRLPDGLLELSAADGFLLRHRSSVVAGNDLRGSLISEQALPELSAILLLQAQPGNSVRSALCADPGLGAEAGGVCVDAHGQPIPAALRPRTSGPSGAQRYLDGTPVNSWQPVGDTGLLLSLALDSAELYEPIRRGLVWGFLFVAVVTGLGVLLLRSRVDPLVRRLVQTEGRYLTVVESLNEGLMLIDADGRVLTANRAAGRILGFDPDWLRGRNIAEVDWRVCEEDGRPLAPEEYPALRSLRTGQSLSNVVLRIERSDGLQRWISVSTASASGIVAGDAGGIVLSFSDITEQRRAEHESASLDARYQTLIGGIADGVVSIDEHGIVHSYNPAAEKIFGWPPGAVLGRNVAMLMPERFRQHHDDNVARFALQKDPAIIGMRRDVVGLRADGNEFPMTLALNVVPGGGEARFVALVTDISERKLAERQLQDAARLRAAILANAPFLVISTDVHGVITAVNPAAERMLWYRADELIGRFPDCLWDLRDVRRRAAELTAELGLDIAPGLEVFVHRARHGVPDEREWTLVRKDGSRFVANIAVTALTDTAGTITGFLGIAYDVTERRRREAYTQHVAHHDFLTGLPNRLLLNDRLSVAIEAARRHQQSLAVMILDLDHFKRINDSLGHQVGDLLLIEVARRLQRVVRASDTVARMGGDEFVLVLPEVGQDPATLLVLAQKIVDAVGQPLNLHGHELHITPSIGVARYPDDGEQAEVLLKNADVALYRTKAGGRNGHRLFNRDMAQAADERLALEAAMRRALAGNGFTLHYQPQLDLDSGELIGMEALLRWQDPQFGVIGPDRFLPIAEETGLIGPLGDWVLNTAIHDAVRLQQQVGRPLRLAVNLSARQFRAPELISRVEALLAESGLAPTQLELEITEGALMHNTEETQTRLRALRALGVAVAVDDFGVGFSSLSYIARFELDTLKIDRSFISALPDSASAAAVVRAVIALATTLGIRLVAEGVETAAQLSCLQELHHGQPGGDGTAFAVQGFHFAEALAPDAFAAAFPPPDGRRPA